MAFDFDSAVPVGSEEEPQRKPTGFDFSSAKPVDPDKNKHTAEEYDSAPEVRSDGVQLSEPASRMERLLRKAKGESLTKGVAEAGLSAVTGLASTVMGGLLGGARTVYRMAAGDSLDEATSKGADTVKSIQMKGTFQPRSATGQVINEMVGAVGEAPAHVTKEIGGEVGESFGGEQGRIAGESLGEVGPSIGMAAAGGVQGVRAARKAAMREPQPVPGKDFSPLRDLTPEQAERMARQKEQGMEPTLGSVTRDPEQFKFEEQMAKTKAGARLRDVELNNNEALIKLVQETDTKRAGKALAENEREVGQSVYTALAEKAAEKKQAVKDLYDKAAESGETKTVVDIKPLEEYLKKNEAEMITVPALKSIQQKLQFLKKSKKGKLTIDDVENLYQSANALSKPGDPSSKFMGDVKRKINDITEGAGGDLYKDARRARLEYGLEFEDRSAIADILAKKSRTDFKMDTEDIFHKTVINSSLDELRDVTNSLLSTDPKTNPKAWQAVREMQAQAIDHLVEEATKGIALNERGAASFSPAGFRKAMRNIGREKLDWLLGKDAVDRLYNALQTAQELKTSPGKVSGSDTMINAQNLAVRMAREEAMKHLQEMTPGLKAISGYLRTKKEQRMLRTQIDEALTPRRAPVETINQMQRDVLRQERQFRMQDYREIAGQAAPAAVAPLLAPDDEE